MEREAVMQRSVYPLVTVVLLSWFLMPAPTWAVEAWYGTVSGGKAWFESDDFIGGTSGPITQKFGHEYGLSAAIGYAFQRFPLRLEGEFTYFRADVDALPGTLTTFNGGSDKHYVGMANLYYDVALSGMLQRLKPYVGLGLGFDVEKWGLSLVAPSGVNTAGRFDTEVFFAYQVKAGLAYALTDRVDALVGYRYFRTAERSLASPTVQASFDHDAQAIHFLEFGLRWDY
jgi:opacity protein-like surface antigen